MGGRERANLTRPRRARLTAATWSRSITTRQLPHQSLRSSRLSDWSLSPHLGQDTLEPLVSRLDKRITGRPTHRGLILDLPLSLAEAPAVHPTVILSTLTVTPTIEGSDALDVLKNHC